MENPHDGRALAPIPERSTSPRATLTLQRWDSLKALDPKRPIREADIGLGTPIGPRSNSVTTRTVNTLPADGLLQVARLCLSTQQEDRMGNDRSKDKPLQVGSRDKKGIKRRDLLLSGSSLIAASALTTSMTGSARAELKEYPPGTTF